MRATGEATAAVKNALTVASLLLWAVKVAALWVVLIASGMAAGMLIPIQMPPAPLDGPFTVMQAFAIVNGAMAVALGLVAGNARVRGWHMVPLIFISHFVIGSAMMQIETLWFNESLKLPLDAIGLMVAQGAIVGLAVGIASALLFWAKPDAAQPVPANVALRVGVMALIYVVLYYGAGSLIAWQSAAVRAFYENGIHIQFVPTVCFQIFRGTLWALIALFIVTRLRGSLARRALVMAVLFFSLTALQLLYPNPFVPWPVRAAHLAEVGSSEFLYGIISTLVLLGGAANHPLTTPSRWRLIAGQA